MMKKCISFICLVMIVTSLHANGITLQLKKTTVKQAIELLKQQSGKSFFFNVNDVNLEKIITVDIKDKTVIGALNIILEGQNLTCETKGDHIVISKSTSISQSKIRVNGTVHDAEGEPLIGVSVMVQNTQMGTITDIDGNFSLDIPSSVKELSFSYLGYQKVTMKVIPNGKPIEVVMHTDSHMMKDVVIVGYGTQKKINLTGAVSVVDAAELASRPASNMSQLLQGAVPNMGVTFGSGRPGESGSFNIRGVGSISANAKPLILIDGVEGNIDRVNPQDVESVSVLKDASASAVYGARASYGVILINTKKGTSDKISVNYSGKYAFNRATTSTDFESRGYYSAAINDKFFETYQGQRYTNYTDKDYHELWIRRNDKTEHPDRPWVVQEDGQYKYYANTDWYDYLFDHSSPAWEHNLSISGGSNKVKYMLSGNYYDRDGILKINSDNFKKYNFRSRISTEITPWLEISNTTSYFHSTYFYPGVSGVANTFASATFHGLSSFVPRNPDGSLVYKTTSTNGGNAIMDGHAAILAYDKHRNRDKTFEFSTSFEARIKPIKNVEVVTNYSYIHANSQNLGRRVNLPYSERPGVYQTLSSSIGENRLSEAQINNWYQSFNVYGTYENTFDKVHSVKVMGGYNSENKRYKDLRMSQTDLLSDDFDDFNLAQGESIEITGGKNKYAILGMFYRLNYDYKGRYLLETSGRYDGSSRFRRGNRFGFFPSVSAGWRLSEENFFADLKKNIDNVKIRASYGTLGNQQVGYYDYLQFVNTGGKLSYAFGDGEKTSYADETAPNAADLTWETVYTKNFGLDLGFLNSRLNASGDYYIRDTKDMLMPGKALPSAYGAKSPLENAANLRTQGWEIMVSWNDKFDVMSKPFNYSIGVGLGDNTSKVTKYDNPDKMLSVGHYKGQKLGDIWGYVVDGYFKTDEEAKNYHVDQTYVNDMINTSVIDKGVHAGDLKFVDLDGDNKINPTQSANDIKDQKVIGNSLPRYNYNANLSANWNGIDLSVFLQGIGRQHWYPHPNTMAFWGPYARPYASFIPTDFMSKVWSEDNPDAYFPRPRGYIALDATRRSLGVANTKYLQDLAYCRIKNITVGYTLPAVWTSKAKLEKVRVYFSGENLFTFTKLDNDYIDPEQASASNSYKQGTSDARTYPWSKTFSFGIDVSF